MTSLQHLTLLKMTYGQEKLSGAETKMLTAPSLFLLEQASLSVWMRLLMIPKKDGRRNLVTERSCWLANRMRTQMAMTWKHFPA